MSHSRPSSATDMRRLALVNQQKETYHQATQSAARPEQADYSSGSAADMERLENVKRLLAERRSQRQAGMDPSDASSMHSSADRHDRQQVNRPLSAAAATSGVPGGVGRSGSPPGSAKYYYYSRYGQRPGLDDLDEIDHPERSVVVPLDGGVYPPSHQSFLRAPSPSPQHQFVEPPLRMGAVHHRLHEDARRLHLQRAALQKKVEEATDGPHEPRITKTAKQLKREGSVENILWRRHEEYRAHKDELRRQKEALELASLRQDGKNRPRSAQHQRPSSAGRVRGGALRDSVRPNDGDPAGDGGPADGRPHERVYMRGMEIMRRRDMLREDERRKQDEDTLKQFSASAPQINPVSSKMERHVDDILRWEEHRKQKLEQKKQQVEDEQERAIREEQWRMNKVSERLVAHMDRSGRVEDRLLQEHQDKQRRLEHLQRRIAEQNTMIATPVLSSHSANIVREGEVSERLYRQQTISFRQKVAPEDQAVLDAISDATARFAMDSSGSLLASSDNFPMQRSHSAEPLSTSSRKSSLMINARSAALARPGKIEDNLLKAGEEKELRRMRKMVEAAEREHHLKNASKMGPYSHLLVRLMEQRTSMSTNDRLRQPTHHFKERTMKDIEEEQRKTYTYRPEISEESRLLDQKKVAASSADGSGDVAVSPRLDRREIILQRHLQQEERKRQLAEELSRKEMEECTFTPRSGPQPRDSAAVTHSKAHQQQPQQQQQQQQQQQRQQQGNSGSGANGNSSNSPDTFMRKNMEWLRQVELERERQRKLQAERELAECTFHPATTSTPRPSSGKSPNPRSNARSPARYSGSAGNGSSNPAVAPSIGTQSARAHKAEDEELMRMMTSGSVGNDDAELDAAIRLLSLDPDVLTRNRRSQPDESPVAAAQSRQRRPQDGLSTEDWLRQVLGMDGMRQQPRTQTRSGRL